LVVSTVGHRVGIHCKDWPNLSLQFKHLLLSEVTLSLLRLDNRGVEILSIAVNANLSGCR